MSMCFHANSIVLRIVPTITKQLKISNKQLKISNKQLKISCTRIKLKTW